MKPILNIVSAGMGSYKLYSRESIGVLNSSKRILSTTRIGEQVLKNYPKVEILTLTEIVGELENGAKDISVLVSGDSGFYSFAKDLICKFGNKYEVRSYSGINSMQYLLSKLGKPYHDVVSLSLHGRKGSPIGAVAYNAKVFLLTDKTNSATAILNQLKDSGMENLEVTVGCDLSSENEIIATGNLETLITKEFSEPAVVYIENPRSTNTSKRLKDEDFIRGAVPMTKEHIRELTLGRLEIQPKDVVYDVGAGTGSVSIAAGFKANRGSVFAVEKSPEAVGLIKQNIKNFGAYNVNVILGSAPECLGGLPTPNKVFIGGSSGNIEGIIAAVLEKARKVIVCVNAITLESLYDSIKALEKQGFSDIEVSCVNHANAKKIGRYNMMKAENPIYIISGSIK